jgi:hypothetical protein
VREREPLARPPPKRLSLLATDRFVASLPGSVLRFNVDQFSLKVLPVDFVTRFFQVAIVTLKNRTVSPVVQTFIDCVRDVARPLRETIHYGHSISFCRIAINTSILM